MEVSYDYLTKTRTVEIVCFSFKCYKNLLIPNPEFLDSIFVELREFHRQQAVFY